MSKYIDGIAEPLRKVVDTMRKTGIKNVGHWPPVTADDVEAAIDTLVTMAECDCVPALISSKSCRKCHRIATIPQEQLLRWMKDYTALQVQNKKLMDAIHSAVSFTYIDGEKARLYARIDMKRAAGWPLADGEEERLKELGN